jgi:DNA-binding CsgD family transcriptional regulator
MQIPHLERVVVNEQLLATLLHTHRALLTDRQKFVAHMTGSGWSSRRIANQLGVSHTTVLADLDQAITIIRKAEAA